MPYKLKIKAGKFMLHVVDVQAQAGVETQGVRGAPVESVAWVTERTDVPCTIIPRSAKIETRAQKEAGVIQHKVFFDAPIDLGITRQLIYRDTDAAGNPRARVLRPGPARNVIEGGQLWVADCEEVQ